MPKPSTVRKVAVAPRKVVIVTAATQSEQGQSLANNMHKWGIAERSIIDITYAMELSEDEKVQTDHRSGDSVEVQQIVMGHPDYAAVVKSCIENSADSLPGAVLFFVRVDPDGVVSDVVAEEEAAWLNAVFIDVAGLGTVPAFDCRHKRLDRIPVEHLGAQIKEMLDWLAVPEVVDDRSPVNDFGVDACIENKPPDDGPASVAESRYNDRAAACLDNRERLYDISSNTTYSSKQTRTTIDGTVVIEGIYYNSLVYVTPVVFSRNA